jgi:hypothetical protein
MMDVIARAKEIAIEPVLMGERRMFSVTSVRRRNIVPRRHMIVMILCQRGNRVGTIGLRRGLSLLFVDCG